MPPVRANIWGPKIYVKSIFGVCELKYGPNSIFGVHKSEERKNRGICLALTSHGMQCDLGVANHEMNVLVLLKKILKDQEAPVKIIKNIIGVQKYITIFGVPKTSGLIFRGQQRNSDMDPPRTES